MNPRIELTSLAISKLRNSPNSFVKYDIEAALDELENTETEVKLKYKFVLLSNPNNTKISVEGIAIIFTNQSELPKYLGLDEKKIPHIINIIYSEIFPLFYILSKSMQIPCPAYRLSQMSTSPPTIETEAKPEKMEEKAIESIENIDTNESADVSETPANVSNEDESKVLQEMATIREPNVSSI